MLRRFGVQRGLPYIAAFVAMALVTALYLYFTSQAATETLHQKGVALAKLLSDLEGHTDSGVRTQNFERLFEHQSTDPQFAYGVIENREGWSVTRLVSKRVSEQLPALQMNAQGGWLQNRTIELGGYRVMEYFGTLGGADSQLFRFGFWQPQLGLNSNEARIGATIGLPILLLVPLFMLFHARSSKPLEEIEQKLSALEEGSGSLQEVQITPNGELAHFIERFNGFVEQVQGKLATAEKNNRKLVTQEKFLSYRADRYEAILQAVPDGILIVDEDLKAVFVNQHVEALFRVDRKKILSEQVDAWCRYEPFLNFVHELRRNGQQVPGTVVTMPYPKQASRTLGVSAHPLFFKKSSTSNSGTLILMRDVSEEIAAKQSRVDFVGSLSHEIKAPLNTIGLYAQMLESNGDDPEFLIETHNVITREVERLTRLVHNLLSITQIEMGTFELDSQRVYLADIVRDCIEMLDHGKDQARIEFDTDDKTTPILVDKELLRIAISNLLTNALKYSEDDTQVTVEIEENEDAIILSVRDRGLGISQEDQARIFDKFYRSADEGAQSKAGHGLGLSIAQEIVKLHHGTLTLDSTLGEGSTFTIELWKRTGIAQQAI